MYHKRIFNKINRDASGILKTSTSVGTPALFFISIQRTELLAVFEEQSHGSMAQRVE